MDMEKMTELIVGSDGVARRKITRTRSVVKHSNALRVENEIGGPTSVVQGIDAVRGISRFVQIGHNHRAGRRLSYGLETSKI